jgi:hypothetical protein
VGFNHLPDDDGHPRYLGCFTRCGVCGSRAACHSLVVFFLFFLAAFTDLLVLWTLKK